MCELVQLAQLFMKPERQSIRNFAQLDALFGLVGSNEHERRILRGKPRPHQAHKAACSFFSTGTLLLSWCKIRWRNGLVGGMDGAELAKSVLNSPGVHLAHLDAQTPASGAHHLQGESLLREVSHQGKGLWEAQKQDWANLLGCLQSCSRSGSHS